VKFDSLIESRLSWNPAEARPGPGAIFTCNDSHLTPLGPCEAGRGVGLDWFDEDANLQRWLLRLR
jgi:hypothetical protein